MPPQLTNPARYWIGTIPESLHWSPSPLVEQVTWARGQREVGEGGLAHWQVVLGLSSPQRLAWIRARFPGHWEPTRSAAAEDYVWKQDTAIDVSRFEIGSKPMQRNQPTDWDAVRESAKRGRLDDIPSDVYVRCYNQLSRIRTDHLVPSAIERTIHVFWGRTGTGKSRRAWEEAGAHAYCKDPRTKWWCGYDSHEHVVIDEFRGDIAISHVLRWFDRYPVLVETKGAARPLMATTMWITSNLSPDEWYPELDAETKLALRRRLNITHFL